MSTKTFLHHLITINNLTHLYLYTHIEIQDEFILYINLFIYMHLQNIVTRIVHLQLHSHATSHQPTQITVNQA